MTRRTTAATLRRYRAEWQAALARRDYAATRAILGTALDVVSKEASAKLETEVRALHDLLALERRLQAIADGVRARFPAPGPAFAVPSTKRFRGPWGRAIEGADYVAASKVLRGAIAAISRRMASQSRSQQALITQLRRLQRAPLKFSAVPARCALCGGADHPGIDSGTLFICAECIQKASEILAETAGPHDTRRAT